MEKENLKKQVDAQIREQIHNYANRDYNHNPQQIQENLRKLAELENARYNKSLNG